MRAKPKFFLILSMVFVSLALSFPVQIFAIYGVGNLSSILSKMTYLNWLLIANLLYLSYLSYRCNKKILFVLPVTSMLVFLNNFFVWAYGQDHSLLMTLTASCGFLAIHAVFYHPKILPLLLIAKNRWWEPSPRFKKALPVKMVNDQDQAQTQYTGLSFDISESGIFMQNGSEDYLSEVPIGQILKVTIELPDGPVNCQAQVVRKAINTSGQYPTGLGLRFLDPSPFFKQNLSSCFEEKLH